MTEAIDRAARILIDEFEAGLVHAVKVAEELARLFAPPIIAIAHADGKCDACGQEIPSDEWKGIAVDRARGEIRFAGKRSLHMTGKEFKMFTILLRAKGRPLGKEELLTELYADEVRTDGELPEMKIIDVFVCKARKKIEPLDVEIGTAWGRGYFIVDPTVPKEGAT